MITGKSGSLNGDIICWIKGEKQYIVYHIKRD